MFVWFFFVISMTFPVFVIGFFVLKYDKLEDEKIKKRFDSLYDGIQIDTKLRAFFHAFFVLRRLITGVIIVLLTEYPAIQIIIIIEISVI